MIGQVSQILRNGGDCRTASLKENGVCSATSGGAESLSLINQFATGNKIHQSRHFQHPPTTDPPQEAQDPDGIVIQLVRLVNQHFAPGRRCYLELPGATGWLTQFAQQAYQDYTLAAPRPAALQTLVQLNVLDALTHNAAALNITIESLCAEHTLSPFVYYGPSRLDEASIPLSLQPTALQRAVYHHPWIDIFPLPEVRDSILRICGTPEEDELNIDLVDVEVNDREKPSLVIWGDHSDPWAWEATIPFLRKWGWLVRDCYTLLDSTNYWRERRGDKRLIFPRHA